MLNFSRFKNEVFLQVLQPYPSLPINCPRAVCYQCQKNKQPAKFYFSKISSNSIFPFLLSLPLQEIMSYLDKLHLVVPKETWNTSPISDGNVYTSFPDCAVSSLCLSGLLSLHQHFQNLYYCWHQDYNSAVWFPAARLWQLFPQQLFSRRGCCYPIPPKDYNNKHSV